MSAYHFVDSEYCRPSGSMPIEYTLTMRQEPDRAKVCTNKEKERRPIDPPPIIQLKIKDDRQDPCHNYLQSPHLFLCVDLCPPNDDSSQSTVSNGLAGTSVSSLYRLKDIDNSDGGFFVFGDLSVKLEGRFRLRFYLFEVRKGDVCFLQSITSDQFQVYNAKQFPGMLDSTFLSRSFSDQGVRIRIRKEHRIKMKRAPQRPILPPEHPSPSQYGLSDQRPLSSHLAASHSPSIPQGHGFDGRPNPEYHYAGVPVRVHVPRQLDYHPYQRNQYPPNTYFDRPLYSDMMPPGYAGPPYPQISSTGHMQPEYALVQTYGRVQPGHSPQGDYYYPTDNRRVPGPPPPAPGSGNYPEYHERQHKAYSELQSRQQASDHRLYPSPYPSDPLRKPEYMPDLRPASSYHAPPAQHYYPQSPQHVRHSPDAAPLRRGPQYYQEPSAPYDYSRSEASQGQQVPQFQSQERRESRHSLNTILSEQGRRDSPLPGSRPASDSSSTGRNSPIVRGDPSSRGSGDDSPASVRLPPLRNGSNPEKQPEGEQQNKPNNSNLWKLVDAATEQ